MSGFAVYVFFFKQKTAYEMRISDWSSDVCSSDLHPDHRLHGALAIGIRAHHDGPTVVLKRCRDDLGRRCRVAVDQHDDRLAGGDVARPASKIGSASCRERVCQYV